MQKVYYKNFILPVSLLSGAIIGAGIFSLPFVFQLSGLGAGFFYLGLAAIVYVFAHLMYGDLILRTKGEHRFVGYVKIYFGEKFFWPAVLMAVAQMILVLTIYLILSKSFSDLIVGYGSSFEKVLIFWFLGSLAIFLTLRRLALLEFLMTGGIVVIIALIFLFGLKDVLNISAVDFIPRASNILVPLAPILFALSGRVAIPSVIDFFYKKFPPEDSSLIADQISPKSVLKIKKVIVWGTILPAVVYGLFVLGIVALSSVVSPDSVTGLISQMPKSVLWILGVLGILSLFSSYIIVGADINNVLNFDFKLPPWIRALIVVGGPILFYWVGSRDFISLVSFTGGVFLALEGIFIILMWFRANKISSAPPVLLKRINLSALSFLILIFAAALVYEISNVIR